MLQMPPEENVIFCIVHGFRSPTWFFTGRRDENAPNRRGVGALPEFSTMPSDAVTFERLEDVLAVCEEWGMVDYTDVYFQEIDSE